MTSTTTLARRTGPRLFALTLVLAGALLAGCAPGGYDGPPSDHFDGKRFFGPGTDPNNSFFDFLWMNLTKPADSAGPWPDWVENRFNDRPPERVAGPELRISYVGHATFLIQTAGLNILTDPHYGPRASPSGWFGPKRVAAPGIAWDRLPPIDIVLISHGHYDHLDQATLARLWQRFKPRIVAPLGHTATIRDGDASIAVEELDWGKAIVAGPVRITLEPMQHWTARGLFDRNRALWGAYAIEAPGGPVYFLADSGYGDGAFIRNVRAKYGPLRLALVPIGAYLPRGFMAFAHMNPAESVQAHLDLGGPPTLAHQHEVFDMADEGYDQPRSDLGVALKARGLPDDRFVAPRVGQSFVYPALP